MVRTHRRKLAQGICTLGWEVNHLRYGIKLCQYTLIVITWNCIGRGSWFSESIAYLVRAVGNMTKRNVPFSSRPTQIIIGLFVSDHFTKLTIQLTNLVASIICFYFPHLHRRR